MAKKTVRSKGQRRVSRSTLRMQNKKNNGIDGFFERTGLTEEFAKRILDGSDNIPGYRPDKVRNMRESLIKFGWKPLETT